MTEKKAALMMADGLEECEALNVYDLLLRAGIDIKTISINDERKVRGTHGVEIGTDLTMAELFSGESGWFEASGDAAEIAEALDMLILPGGMPGTTNLGSDARLISLIIEMDRREKWLTAICAAPSVYAQAGILTGYRATCYPSFMPELDVQGANVEETPVVVDGHFATSRGLGTAISFGLTLIRLLAGADQAGKIREEIVSEDEIF